MCVQGSCSCSGQFDSPLQQSLDWETIAKQFEGYLFVTFVELVIMKSYG